MKAAFRQLEPGETDLEILGLTGCVCAAISVSAWLAEGLPLPRCVFHAMTGCPCPTCGATRCMLALLRGHVAGAFAWNPLVFAGLAGLTLFNLYAAAALAARMPRLRLSFNAVEGRILRAASVLLVAVNWGYEIHHQV